MRGNRESAEPHDILDDVAPLSAQLIRGRRKTERNNVAVLGADFDRVDTQNALEVLKRVRLACGVTVVGQYDEVEPARAAAAAIAPTSPVPSERLVWT